VPVPTAKLLLDDGAFGSGGHHPYDRALRDPSVALYLRDAGAEPSAETAAGPSDDPARLDVERFLAAADTDDAETVSGSTGPVLDIGCGPGRLVHAAIMAGHLALGIDISRTAVAIAQEHGLPVLRRSVFDDLPAEGTWGTALLIDGNIGIGGDPTALLARCAELVRPGDGRVRVETHPDRSRDRRFQGIVVDEHRRASLPFPWAEVGAAALRRHAHRTGWALTREWTARGRTFAEFVRVDESARATLR
jgi:SAM-dependent methyltransferase